MIAVCLPPREVTRPMTPLPPNACDSHAHVFGPAVRFPYADARPFHEMLVKINPERLVWGSDWPHPSEREKKPDDAILFDLMLAWVPDEKTRNRVLVDNPAVLYDFPKTA